jgi:glutamate 5-kinase
LVQIKRAVVKIGSSALSSPRGGLDGSVMDRLAYLTSAWRRRGIECVLVTSGAIAAGVDKLRLAERPGDIAGRQAAAAVGQGILIEKYGYFFDIYNLVCAQILLTRADLNDPAHYANASATFEKLLSYGAVPIVNENDTVSHEEIRFGDNDNLSALVAGLVNADILILLTDVEGLYDKNPATDASAKFIRYVKKISDVAGFGEGPGALGTGGMRSKIAAAQTAAGFNIPTFVARGKNAALIEKLADGELPDGTYIEPVV